MKRTAKIFAMTLVLSACTWLTSQNLQAHTSISVRFFYDNLSPYGTWVDNPDFGYVWIPNAEPGFFPYQTAGYWVYSDFGWTWVSDYSWGWAPFHYGRWYFDDWYGWAWVPGTEWGPGWVTWSRCDGYYGWAPLSPGFTFTMHSGWRFHNPAREWIFLPDRYFGRHDIGRYYIDRHDNDRFCRHSKIIENTGIDRETHARYFSGPEVKEVRRVTGRDFSPLEVRSESRPGQRVNEKRLEIYRPRVERTIDNDKQRTAPEKYEAYKDRSRKAAPAPARKDPSASDRKSKNGYFPGHNPGNERKKPASEQAQKRTAASEKASTGNRNSKDQSRNNKSNEEKRRR